MTAPTVHRLEITVGAGRNRPQGSRVGATNGTGPVRALHDLLSGLDPSVPDIWWSGNQWANDRREGAEWRAAWPAVVDVDYQNAAGKHDTPRPEHRAILERAAKSGDLPCNLAHGTPRGARFVFVLPAPETDAERMKRILRGAAHLAGETLDRLGIAAGSGSPGYVVDAGALDLARIFFAPRCTVVGSGQRNYPVLMVSEEPIPAETLLASAATNGAPATRAPTPRASEPEPWDLPPLVSRVTTRARTYVDRAVAGECATVETTPPGGRNAALNRAAFNLGQLVGGGVLERERAEQELVAAAEACGLVQDDGLATVERTIRSGIEGGMKQPRGLPESTDGTSASQVAGQGLPRIEIVPDMTTVVDRAQSALTRRADVGIYVRGRRLVRIVRDKGRPRRGLQRPPGAPVIEPIPGADLRERLSSAATWVVHDGRSKGPRVTLPPEWVAETLMARERWDFPLLEGVVESPALRPDGSLLDAPGYDEATGLLLEPSGGFPPVPPSPTPEQVVAAVTALLDPFRDFPFLNRDGRAAAAAATLTLVGRHAIDGPVPLFAIRAPTPGTGKSLLADAISMIVTGRAAARMVPSKDDDEARKRILAIALEGDPLVLLDNVDAALGSQSLASALTATEWTDRLLGSSTKSRAPLRAVWFATGNGLTFRGDLGRRVVPIDLDAQVEHPEDRTGFAYADLLGHLRTVRRELVVAALTVLRGYVVAGRPSHGKPPMGSFEAWDGLVRGACVWAELGDPSAGRERIRQEDDSDLDSLGVALNAWLETFGETGVTTASAVRRAESDPQGTLRDALLGLSPGREKLDSRALGYALRRVRGRIVDGLRFLPAGQQHKVGLWRVEDLDGPEDEGEMGTSGDMFSVSRTLDVTDSGGEV